MPRTAEIALSPPTTSTGGLASVDSGLALPVILGGLVRLAFAAVAPLSPQWDGEIYVRGAELLASGQGYTQRILDLSAPATPTAFFPVGFPFVLASIRRAGFGLRTDLVVQALAGSLSLVLLAYVASRLVGTRIASRALWIHALSPGAILLTGTWLAEPLVTLGVLCALAFATHFSARRPWLACAGLGLVLGLTAYLRATPLVMAPIVAFGLGLVRRRGLGTALLFALVASAAAVLPLAPWALRNERALGAPVLVSTNGGVNLLIGTFGDGSYRDVPRPARCGAESTELALDRCRSEVAFERIRSAPLSWVGRGLSKLWHTFGHDSAPAQHLALANARAGASLVGSAPMLGLARLHWLTMLSFAVFGAAARLLRRPGRAHALIFGPILGLGLLHFVYLGGDRYHAPIAPLLALLAAEATTRLRRERPVAGRRSS